MVAFTAVLVAAVIGAHFAFEMSSELTLTVLAWTPLLHACVMLVTLRLWLQRRGMSWADLGFGRPTPRLLHVMWQLPVVLVAIVATNAVFLTLVGGNDQPDSNGAIEEVARGVGGLHVGAILVALVVVVPLWEEAVFRGVVYAALRQRMSLVWVSLLSAGLFALFHAVPVLIPYYIVMGVALALLRTFHANLWAPVIVHSAVNFLAGGTALLLLLAA